MGYSENKFLEQPVGAIAWKTEASVKVHKLEIEGRKLFQCEITWHEDKKRFAYGLPVNARSKALSQAVDFCSARHFRISMVEGVRPDKYKLW